MWIILCIFMCAFVSANDNENTPLQYDIMDSQLEQPSCLGQSAAAVINWLLCGCAFAGEVFACCTRTTEPLCQDPTSCNPLQKKYIDPYQPEQEGLCHEGCFLACPCFYRNQIPYEDCNDDN